MALGAAVAALGIWEATGSARAGGTVGERIGVALLIAAAGSAYRVAPGAALGLVWVSSAIQVTDSLDVAFVQLAVMVVSYGTARYGGAVTLWCSGLSIPVGSAIALLYVRDHGTQTMADLGTSILPTAGIRVSLATAFLLAFLVLSAPWALGLLMRVSTQFRVAREDRERAEVESARLQEIAEVRAEQARLARDVHDVVGHSLAVIVAQADSAQYMSDSDISQIRAAITNISTSARQSLGDVRQVLSSTNDASTSEAATRSGGGMEGLVAGVRSAGHDVRSEVHGSPRPLTPERDLVAYHVLQEMLTNTLKHGRRDRPISVERTWSDDALRIQVRNSIAESGAGAGVDGSSTGPQGVGLQGMRRRLAAVGGRLSVDVGEVGPDLEPEYTATAWIPGGPEAATDA